MSSHPIDYLYLAGAISGLTYEECIGWRDRTTEMMRPHGICCLSPMRTKAYLSSEPVIDGEYASHVLSSQKGITRRDRHDVYRSAVVLANLLPIPVDKNGSPRVSIGTMMEFGWSDAWQKPLVVCMDLNGPYCHPMVLETADFVVPTLEEAIDVTLSVLGRK